ncbi:MAG TPA: paraquat-inducible protein A [Steroidobacteraceae bacterium]|nr:paraquat-inducible protein A [Steroidobacteraceae bacterium]
MCIACGHTLARHQSFSVDQLLALTVAAALCFLIGNAYPLMTIDLAGMHTEATAWGTALLMLHGWAAVPGVVLAVSMFLLPLLQIALLLWVLSFARMQRPAPGLRAALVVLHRSRSWSMTEVFLLGALVAIVKLSSWLHVVAGIGLWALLSLTILLTILSLVEGRFWWSLAEASE